MKKSKLMMIMAPARKSPGCRSDWVPFKELLRSGALFRISNVAMFPRYHYFFVFLMIFFISLSVTIS